MEAQTTRAYTANALVIASARAAAVWLGCVMREGCGETQELQARVDAGEAAARDSTRHAAAAAAADARERTARAVAASARSQAAALARRCADLSQRLHAQRHPASSSPTASPAGRHLTTIAASLLLWVRFCAFAIA